MSKFKVGDKVRVVKGTLAGKVGFIADSDNKYHYHVDIRGVRNFAWFHEHYLELVEEDPYAELKKAYINGKTIQCDSNWYGEWCDITRPTWCDPPERYRVKPEGGGMKVGHIDVITAKAGVGKSFVMNVTKKQPKPKKEMKMKFETKHYLNGQDIKNLENIEIYREIAREESALKALGEVQNKPKRLQKEIAQREAELKAFVEFLDAQDKGA